MEQVSLMGFCIINFDSFISSPLFWGDLASHGNGIQSKDWLATMKPSRTTFTLKNQLFLILFEQTGQVLEEEQVQRQINCI